MQKQDGHGGQVRDDGRNRCAFAFLGRDTHATSVRYAFDKVTGSRSIVTKCVEAVRPSIMSAVVKIEVTISGDIPHFLFYAITRLVNDRN
jgi:hypothetical protein